MSLRIQSPLPAALEAVINRTIGAAIEVHRQLGPGFLESIYEQALGYELGNRGIRFVRQKEIAIRYKDIVLTGQRIDLIIEEQIIVELKTVEQMLPIHEAQLISYLKSTGLRAGLLINFKVQILKTGIKRIVL